MAERLTGGSWKQLAAQLGAATRCHIVRVRAWSHTRVTEDQQEGVWIPESFAWCYSQPRFVSVENQR